jgi:hypothetical protein
MHDELAGGIMFSPRMANPRLDKTGIDRREFLPSPFFIYIDGKNSPETDSMALAADPNEQAHPVVNRFFLRGL